MGKAASKPIDAGQEIGIATGWWEWADDVYVDLLKAVVWGGESRKWCDCVPLNFRPLTPKA
jgi:hypothetical protein